MVASMNISLASVFPVQSSSGSMGIDIHSPNFIGNVSKLLKTLLDARQRADEELLARVQSEVKEGGDVMRLNLLEDEMRYRRDEELTVVAGMGKLIARLSASETVDMARIDSEVQLKRASEANELSRLRREQGIIADMQRRADASYGEARRDGRPQELQLRRRYPGTPDARRLPSRLDRDIPRRRAASIANLKKAMDVFETCERVATERQRRREEEAQDLSHITSFNGDDSIMEEDEDSDSDDEENEITIHGNFEQTVRAVKLAAPPQRGNLSLDDLRSEWEKVREEVDNACRDWEASKAKIAESTSNTRARRAYYCSAWSQLKADRSPSTTLTFSSFPWPLLVIPATANGISLQQVAEFFDEGLSSVQEEKKMLQDALKQWGSDSFAAHCVLQYVQYEDVEAVKLGRMIVYGHLAQLLQSYA